MLGYFEGHTAIPFLSSRAFDLCASSQRFLALPLLRTACQCLFSVLLLQSIAPEQHDRIQRFLLPWRLISVRRVIFYEHILERLGLFLRNRAIVSSCAVGVL